MKAVIDIGAISQAYPKPRHSRITGTGAVGATSVIKFPNSQAKSNAMISSSSQAFLFIPLKGTLATLVKDGHGFIGGSNLDLHKIGLPVLTFRTRGAGAIDILPSGFATQDVHVVGSAATCVTGGYIRANGNPL